MSTPDLHRPKPILTGGLAQYFVEHREVGWMALVAVLIWGGLSFFRLAQQEDPRIPERRAMLVTRFPGASTAKIEQLVTRKLEKKITELESIEEIKSQSRSGVSVLTITQRSARQSVVEQEWDKLRAKLKEAALPEGCGVPNLDTDFGNTITLLYALASPPISEAECLARAEVVRHHLAQLRAGQASTNRAAVCAFYPPTVSKEYRATLTQKFTNLLARTESGLDPRTVEGEAFAMADFQPLVPKEKLRELLRRFNRELAGTDGELHPDFAWPLVLIGNEDPLPQIRQAALPRYSYRELEMAAELFEDEVKQLGSVGRVRKIGTVDEMVYLFFSTATVAGFALTPDEVIQAIAARNAIIPGGNLRTEGQNFPVQLSGEFYSEKDLSGVILGVAKSGKANREKSSRNPAVLPIYARDIFDVRRGYENPIPFKVDVLNRTANGSLDEARAVMVAIEMKEGNIIGQFNALLQATVETLKARLPEGIQVLRLSDQPGAVSQRIKQFMQCFIEAVMIVILVALFLMDWRSATIVATAIPLTIAMTFGGMHLLGVPLHQISIAALIVALGMLVDDPVVASDGINRELAAGQPRQTAAWLGPFKLRRAILFATLINIVAFLPLVLLPSDKGAFILALPVVVSLALISSRIVSMTFIPLLGYYLLRGQKGLEAGGEVRRFPLFGFVDRAVIALLPKYRWFLEAALDRPGRTILIAYALWALSFCLTPLFGRQFFPPAERNQMLIDVELPESASIVQTREACREVVSVLKSHDEIISVAVFTGGTAPRFYYNVSPREPGHFLAQVLINTRRAQDVPGLIGRLREELDARVVARCLVKQLEQGPPVEAPIQIRLSGEDLNVLRGLADQVAQVLRTNGAYQVNDDLGRKTPTLQIDIDQAQANTLGVNNVLVGRLAQAAFTGLKVTELREKDHLIPVVIRLRPEERNEADKIKTMYVETLLGDLVPLENYARLKIKPEFAAVGHFGQLRAVTVKAYSFVGQLPSAVLAKARPALDRIGLPAGYKLEYAGEDKELNESQSEMGQVMLISLALIAVAMIIEFNSVSKSLVVMLTVPLGLIGAFTGLAITQAALGFMALLGMVSLAGVIVSHIIVLSDFIEEARAEGMELKAALRQAGLVRLRAVLVTVLATVCGLVPLALTGGELWRPLTSVHIFGLLFATILTLVLLPVLYYVFCARFKWIK